MQEDSWEDYSLCPGLDTELFFSIYEDDEDMRPVVKSICAVCPVQRECLQAGKMGREYGVWGMVHLEAGIPSGI